MGEHSWPDADPPPTWAGTRRLDPATTALLVVDVQAGMVEAATPSLEIVLAALEDPDAT